MLTGQYVCLQACTGCRYADGCKARASKKRYEKVPKEERRMTAPKDAPKYQYR